MLTSTKLRLLSTHGNVLDCEQLAIKCTEKCCDILFSNDSPKIIQFDFSDGSSIDFDGMHINEYSGRRRVFTDSKESNFYNTKLPTHLEFEEYYLEWIAEKKEKELKK